MMLAYQLASNGIHVRVLERHPDFKREFRGELMQRSVIDELEKAGIFRLLLERGLALPGVERRMFVGLCNGRNSTLRKSCGLETGPSRAPPMRCGSASTSRTPRARVPRH